MAKKRAKAKRKKRAKRPAKPSFGNLVIGDDWVCTSGSLVEGREEEPYERIAEYWEDERESR